VPKFKTIPVDFLDRPRSASYGMPELRAICKITGTDPFKGEHWVGSITHDNAVQILHVLLRREDPSLTVEALDEMVSPSDVRAITDVCVQAQLGMTLEELEKAAGEKAEIPLSRTPDTGLSAG
jgi:hypothetical protein